MKKSTKIAATLTACALCLSVPALAFANGYMPAEEAVILSFPDGRGGYLTAHDLLAQEEQEAANSRARANDASTMQVSFDTPVDDKAHAADNFTDNNGSATAAAGEADENATASGETLTVEEMSVATETAASGIASTSNEAINGQDASNAAATNTGSMPYMGIAA